MGFDLLAVLVPYFPALSNIGEAVRQGGYEGGDCPRS